MKKRAGWLEALRNLGPIGAEAADYITNLKASVTAHHKAELTAKDQIEKAERETRDLARECERLRRKIAELQTSPQR